jgi:uncharacterized membrane protein
MILILLIVIVLLLVGLWFWHGHHSAKINQLRAEVDTAFRGIVAKIDGGSTQAPPKP